MRVIFIIPPFGLMKDNGKIKQKMGFLPYLGLASIATILKNEGHSIKILDLQVKNMPLDAIIMEIKKFNADIVGFSVTSPLITVVEEIAQRIKKELNLPIICGGHIYQFFQPKYYKTISHLIIR